MSVVYFGSHKGKILRSKGGKHLVVFDGKEEWLPLSKLSMRIETDVDGLEVLSKYLEPILKKDLKKYQTIAFKDLSFGVYVERQGDILQLEGTRGRFYRPISDAIGIIIEDDKVVNEKLLRKIERYK
jgi:hypothetical protein